MRHFKIGASCLVAAFFTVSALPPWYPGGVISQTTAGTSQSKVFLPIVQINGIEGGRGGGTMASPVGQNTSDWSLTFNDEFDGASLDRGKWRTDYWNGGNGELQEYANDDSHNNYAVHDGNLSLVTHKEYYAGKSYSSGVITTQERFSQQYGFFEMRAKLPSGKGLWPAFWLMPNPTGWPPEIDIMEFLGYSNSPAYMTYHYSGGQSQNYYHADFCSGYHTYGVKWTANDITWYIDGVVRNQYTDESKIPNIPMFIIANLAVGGSWPGSPDGSTPFPSSFDIDYIRAWRPAG